MIVNNLSTLKIYKLTQKQYQDRLTTGEIEENALYLTPEPELDTTLSIAGRPADAAAVRSELNNLLYLIENLNNKIETGGLIVVDDDNGNVEVIAIPPSWSISDDGTGNIVVTSALAILPSVTEENNGQFMRVIDGQWTVASIDNAESSEF